MFGIIILVMKENKNISMHATILRNKYIKVGHTNHLLHFPTYQRHGQFDIYKTMIKTLLNYSVIIIYMYYDQVS